MTGESERGAVPVIVWAVAAAVAVALLAVITRPGAERLATLGLLAAGAAAGVAAGLLLGRRRSGPVRPRATMERINDGAFVVVLVALWGLAMWRLGPWAGLVTGLGAGFCVGLLLVKRPGRDASPA